MPKTALEKQIEKAERVRKQQAKKQLDAMKKQTQEAQRMARKEEIRQQAASIVACQQTIAGFRIMDQTSEEVLRCLINLSESGMPGEIEFDIDDLPGYVRSSVLLELEKLTQYGMISAPSVWLSGQGSLNLHPQAFTYFAEKEAALNRQEEKQMGIHIESLVNSGNMVWGNAVNSNFSIDNSVKTIEHEIEERGGADAEELKALLVDVQELMENIQDSRSIPKQKGLFNRLTEHMSKHGWFYAEVVALLGQQAITMLAG